MKRTIGTALLSLVVLVLAGPVFQTADAQELQVGYTDHELIIVNMPEYQDLRQELEEDYQGDEQELQEMYQEFQEQVERYQRQQGLLSEERRQEREQELMEMEQEIQQQAQQRQEDLAEREAEMLSPLLERVDQAIQDVAQENSLDLVLRNQVGPMQPVILYVNPERISDITLEVARNLGLDVTEEDVEEGAPVSSN